MTQTKCVDECSSALAYAKGKGASYATVAKRIEDCVKLCNLREDFEKRGSDLLAQVQTLCAEACARCATSCEATNDEQLMNCIEQCRTCEGNCK